MYKIPRSARAVLHSLLLFHNKLDLTGVPNVCQYLYFGENPFYELITLPVNQTQLERSSLDMCASAACANSQTRRWALIRLWLRTHAAHSSNTKGTLDDM